VGGITSFFKVERELQKCGGEGVMNGMSFNFLLGFAIISAAHCISFTALDLQGAHSTVYTVHCTLYTRGH